MANKNIKGITIEIEGKTTKLEQALKTVNKTVYSTNNELKGLNKALKLDPKNTELLAQKQELLKKNISATKDRLEKLKEAQKQMGDYSSLTEEQKEQYRYLSVEITKSENALKDLNKELKDFGSVGTQKIAAVGEDVKKTGDKITDAGKKMMGASTVATGVGAAIVMTGANFESSMRQVAATMGITADEINNGSEAYKILEEAAQKSGKETKYSASEAAEALNYLALAGYDATKSAETLPKVLNLAAAGGLDLATASDMVTDAMAALGLETSDLDRYIDEMAKTSQKSNTSVAQLGEATLTVAGVAKTAGMDLETMNAELGVLANNGIKGAEGGTHLRNVILSLTSPTDSASKALKKLGIDVLDSSGNVRNLNDIMKDFDSKLSGLSDGKKTEIISTIFNKTDISAVNALIKGSGEEFSNLSKELNNANGAAQSMADTMNSSLEGQMTLLKSQLEGVAIQLSNVLIPIVSAIVEKISGLITWFSNLSPEIQKVIVIIGMVVAVAGPILIFVGKIISAIGTIMTILPAFAPIITVITTVIKGLFALIMANPVVAIVAAIIAAIVLLWTKCEWFRDAVTAIAQTIWNVIKSAVTQVINIFNSIISFVKSNWQALLLMLVNPFAGAFKLLYDNCSGFRNFINGFVKGVINIFRQLPSQMISIGRNMITGLINGVTGMISTAVNAVKNVGKKILSGIKGVFGIHSPSTVFRDEIGKNLGLGVIEGIEATAGDVQSAMRQLNNQIQTSINPTINPTVKNELNYDVLINAFKDALSEMKVELDDEVAGSFVEKTVSRKIYS